MINLIFWLGVSIWYISHLIYHFDTVCVSHISNMKEKPLSAWVSGQIAVISGVIDMNHLFRLIDHLIVDQTPSSSEPGAEHKIFS